MVLLFSVGRGSSTLCTHGNLSRRSQSKAGIIVKAQPSVFHGTGECCSSSEHLKQRQILSISFVLSASLLVKAVFSLEGIQECPKLLWVVVTE